MLLVFVSSGEFGGVFFWSENVGCLFLAPVGRNDARASVFRPMETLQNVRFPARLSRKLSCGVGVGWDGMC